MVTGGGPLPGPPPQAGEGTGDYSPLSERCFLLFNAEGSFAPEEQARIAARLRQLPCPSIAVAAEENALTQASDVYVADAAAAAPLIENIRRCPIAAAVLVQLLRTTESMPVLDALTVESLAYATLQGGPEFRRWLDLNRAATPAQPSDAGPAVVLQREGDALNLELNRPSNRNAFNVEMRDAMVEALQLVLSDDSIRSVHIRGRGKCFSTGGDLTEFGSAPDPATAHAVRSLSVPGRFLAQCADRVEIHVHGACIGSAIEFPAFARRMVAAEDAFFQLPELKFGLIPGAGGCVSIPRRIGRQRTAYLVLSGKRINAHTALDWGLVDGIAV